jgi:predicted transcriptional regulator
LKLLENHIVNINRKLQQLLRNFSALQKQCAQQEDTIKNLKAELEKSQHTIKLLEEQQLILKSSTGKMNEADKKAMEQVIGKYIKEIDKCIALLSE